MLMWIIFTYLVKSIRNVTSLVLKKSPLLIFFSVVGIFQLESHLRYRLYYSQFLEKVAVVNSRWAEKCSAFLTFVYFFVNVNYFWFSFVVCLCAIFVHLFFLLFHPQMLNTSGISYILIIQLSFGWKRLLKNHKHKIFLYTHIL